MRHRLWLRLSAFFLCWLILHASMAIGRSADTPLPTLPPGTDLSLIIQPVGDTTPLYQYRPDTLRLPASTLKLLTALAATLYLRADYQFETQLRALPQAITPTVLQGNLYLRFSGDPTLTRHDLHQLLMSLKHQGIQRITGDIILDRSAFSGYDRGSGWVWDDLGICYSAPVSPIVLDRNCVKAKLQTGRQTGDLAKVVLPKHALITASSQVITLSETEIEARHCDLEMDRLDGNHYRLRGCVAQQPYALPLAIAIDDPVALAQVELKRLLPAVGLQVDGAIRPGRTPVGTHLMGQHRSPALSEIVQIMLKKSDNLIADALLKTLGRRYFQQPGHFANGIAALKAILFKEAGIDLTHTFLADGSGLSRYNLITAQHLLMSLSVMQAREAELKLIDKLPISGVDGTLRRRQSLQQDSLKGRVVAKTGALRHVSSLAGYMHTVSGKTMMFVLLVNGYHHKAENQPELEQPPPLSPLAHFERILFKALYKEDMNTIRQLMSR